MTDNLNLESNFKEWSLVYTDFDSTKEKSRESLLAIGNGYLGIRGAMEESNSSEAHYPGMYIAGLYNRLYSDVGDRQIENEDYVNCPNALFLTFRINGGKWFYPSESNIESVFRELDFKTGVLVREMVVTDDDGRKTRITSQRLASMDNPHLIGLKYSVKPLNYSGKIEICSELDGDIINDGVERYRSLNQKHLKTIDQGIEDNLFWLRVETNQSEIEVSMSAQHRCLLNELDFSASVKNYLGAGKVRQFYSGDVSENQIFSLEKIVSVYTSKDDDVENPHQDSLFAVQIGFPFIDLVAANAERWDEIWRDIDIEIEGDPKSQMLIRLHLYHLMVTASPHNIHIDAGIPARGLHGEAYRGHIFWDELYILPVYNLFLPDVAKSILRYRYRRLDEAREYAKEYGYQGAMFPWQSGSDGREETQVVHLNPLSGEWGDDYSSLQRHISIAIAYNVWYYFQTSKDIEFLQNEGAELFLDICRFWASKCQLNNESGRFEISKVMGPDEFHEEHHKSEGGGVKDNAYTNLMVSWLFRQAEGIWDTIGDEARDLLSEKLNLSDNEIQRWQKIASKLNLVISDEGIIGQFDGYFELDELDWDGYRKKYTNIYRLDRILKAEGKSPDDYKLAKQADTLMSFYNLDQSIISDLMSSMGYEPGSNILKDNYQYYIGRTSHGSTLSRVVHAYLANQMDETELAWELYSEALESDFTDIQGGTTAEGIHAGVMGGTVLMALTSFAGINFMGEHLSINPKLPKAWTGLSFRLKFRGSEFSFCFTQSSLEIVMENKEIKDSKIIFLNKVIVLRAGEKMILDY